MLHAMEQIRRMRGGAQSHLMRCSDGYYYVVKFQNNPQHRRILVNELLGTRLAARLGLPTTRVAVVEVSEELIRLTPDLTIELPRSRLPCQGGLQFGSQYPGRPKELTVFDFLPDEQLREVNNLHDFAGMLVFDKWTCNTNGRQTVFFRKTQDGSPPSMLADHASRRERHAEQTSGHYQTAMIDQGFCFNAGEWSYPDAPLRGLYARNRVYEGVTGMESFAPWIDRIQNRVTERVLDDILREIPPAWYEDDYEALLRLVEQLHRRRTRVPELLLAAKNTNRQPFANWR
jgi:hypothetical protein